MSLDIVKISFFVEHQTFAFNKGHNFLQNIIGGQIDLINQNPISIFDGFDEIALKKTEDKVVINFI